MAFTKALDLLHQAMHSVSYRCNGMAIETASKVGKFCIVVLLNVALAVAGAIIRSSIMSHITFKMCQFVLIIYLRDYHYDFDLDIVVLWSCYGVLRLTYTTYQNLCPTDHFFGQLLMSQDTSPTWIVLLEYISDYPGIFSHFPHVLR